MKNSLKKDDTVIVTAGKERGKTGKVVRVLGDREKVLVERINMIKRHQKGAGPQQPGGIIEKEAPIAVSNVMLLCPACNKPTRVGRKRLEQGGGVRVCRSCGEAIDKA
ncbi:MAG: 50S ribosomal protein L24 [Deltaproteobacteria bacterium]